MAMMVTMATIAKMIMMVANSDNDHDGDYDKDGDHGDNRENDHDGDHGDNVDKDGYSSNDMIGVNDNIIIDKKRNLVGRCSWPSMGPSEYQ